jgi:CRP-like cAMP-binding protein
MYLPVVSRGKYFRNLEEDVLRAMLEEAQERRIRRGQTLFRQGEPAKPYLHIRGRMKATYLDPEGGLIVARIVHPVEFMGGLRALGIPNYVNTAQASHDSTLLTWDDAVMARLMTRYPGITVAIAELMADLLKMMVQRLAELSTLAVEQRLARAVLRLALATDVIPPALHMSRQDLAEFSGTTLYTVSRIISDWARRGLVTSGRMHLIVKDLPRLSAIATRAHPRAGSAALPEDT